jgi:transposase InsO family protein
MLKAYGISISMTEDYKPTDNAVAERTNGIIKVECVYRQKCFNSFEHACRVIERYWKSRARLTPEGKQR